MQKVRLITEYQDGRPVYTVRDSWNLTVIQTSNYTLARGFFEMCSRGHTARTLFMISRRPRRYYSR